MAIKKSITKNYLYNLSYQILVLVLPLITTPYLSKVLGAENIGIYSYTLSIATYFVLFGSLGVTIYGQREIAYVQDNKYERSKIFFELLIMRFVTMVISLIIFYIIFAINGQYNIYYKILTLEIVANMLDICWFFQGLEEFKKTVAKNMIIKTISVVSIFLFVKDTNDLIIYFIVYVLSNVFGNLTLWFYLPKYIQKVKKINIIKHIKPTIALFIPQIAMQVYNLLDKIMLGQIISDMSEVGNYEQSQKIIKIALTLVTSLGTVVSPRIAKIIADNEKGKIEDLAKSFNFVYFLGIPIMLGIIATSNNLVPWFLGEEFKKSKILLIIGAPLVMAIGLNNVSGIQYLIPSKKQNIYTKSIIAGAIFNFITNLFLIPIFKSIGAIIASVLAESLVFAIQLIYIRKDINLKIVYKNCLKYIVSGVCMFIVTFGIGLFIKVNFISTIIQVIVGIVTYGIMLIILKDKMLYDTLSKISNMVIKN